MLDWARTARSEGIAGAYLIPPFKRYEEILELFGERPKRGDGRSLTRGFSRVSEEPKSLALLLARSGVFRFQFFG